MVHSPIGRTGTIAFYRSRTVTPGSWVFGQHGGPKGDSKNKEVGWDPQRFQFRLSTADVSGLEAGPRFLVTSFHLRRQHKVAEGT